MQVLVGACQWIDSAKVGMEMHQPSSCRAAFLQACWVLAESSGTLGRPEQQEQGLHCAHPAGTSLISWLLHGAGGYTLVKGWNTSYYILLWATVQ